MMVDREGEVREVADYGTTQRGHPVLFDSQGHAYVIGKKNAPGNKTYWRCARKNYGCKARVHTRNKWIVAKIETHNHEPRLSLASAVVKSNTNDSETN